MNAEIQTADERVSNTQAFLQALARGRWYTVIPVFGAFAALYLTTWVGNVGDTDDVYYFSFLVENFPLNYVGDPRLMLYKAWMQWAYHGFHLFDIKITGIELMRGFSALCGAAAVIVFFQMLARDLKVHVIAAAVATLLLAFSYGYWRYAIEAEVYVPAILMLLIALRWFYHLDEKEQIPGFSLLMLGLFSGITVLFYQPNAIPLALAFTIMLIRRQRCCSLIAYGVVVGAVILGGYWGGYQVYSTHPMGVETFQDFLAQRSLEFVVWPFDEENIIRATLGSVLILSHDLLAANWLFAHDWVSLDIKQLFAYEWFVEKQYAASVAGWKVQPPLVILPIVALILLWLTIRAFPFGFKALFAHKALPYLVWVLFSGLVVWRLNPYGPEAWIMLLPPIVVVFTLFILNPAVEKGVRYPLLALVVLTIAHNAISGIGIIHDRLSEYAVAKTQWILDNANEKDVVLIVDDNPLFMTMTYRSKAMVLPVVLEAAPIIAEGVLRGRWRVKLASELSKDFRVVMMDDLFKKTLEEGNRVIFTSDFFEGSRRRQYEHLSDSELDMLDQLRSKLKLVWEDDQLGAVYVLDKPLN